MATLIVLHYGSGLVTVVEDIYTKLEFLDVEDYIIDILGMSIGYVNYMVTNEEYPIEYI